MSDFLLHPASLAIPFRYRLSTRIVTLSRVALALVLSMIAGTLWLSWQLEGAGAAINDAGSLRMRAGTWQFNSTKRAPGVIPMRPRKALCTANWAQALASTFCRQPADGRQHDYPHPFNR